jgi:metal-responsive CopG/Arc/MetJ family transcriptional regulator
MAVLLVNIPFEDGVLNQIDQIARREAKTRSELIGEAAKIYAEKKNWERICSCGRNLAEKYKFTEDDVNEEIEKYRKEKE